MPESNYIDTHTLRAYTDIVSQAAHGYIKIIMLYTRSAGFSLKHALFSEADDQNNARE
jgi:hypothetical protein